MILKMFRAVWFLSAVLALAALLYVYAGLPEAVVVQQRGLDQVSLDREVLFYIVLGLLTLANVLVYLVSKMYRPDALLRTWYYGLTITLNIFFVIGFSFVGVINSQEKFNYESVGFVVYGSVALVLLWAFSWPVIKIVGLSRSK